MELVIKTPELVYSKTLEMNQPQTCKKGQVFMLDGWEIHLYVINPSLYKQGRHIGTSLDMQDWHFFVNWAFLLVWNGLMRGPFMLILVSNQILKKQHAECILFQGLCVDDEWGIYLYVIVPLTIAGEA